MGVRHEARDACAVLVAAEEGVLDLDEPAGPPGSTVRHLLAHASGLPFEGDADRPARRAAHLLEHGYELLGERLAEARLDALRRVPSGRRPRARSAWRRTAGDRPAGLWGTLDDLAAFAQELLAPPLVAPETLAEATATAPSRAWSASSRVGRRTRPTGASASSSRTRSAPLDRLAQLAGHVGHFGGAGSFLWLDRRPLARARLPISSSESGPLKAWPRLSDAVSRSWPAER